MDFEGAKKLPDENVPVEDIIIWIDPLDATQEFTEKLLQYVTTLICITVKGKLIIGIIHQPFEKKTGFKTLQLIEGKADAYIHITLIKKWDICAGDALIKSADGKMTTLQGVNIEYSSKNVTNDNGLVATLQNHEEYLKLLSNIHN